MVPDARINHEMAEWAHVGAAIEGQLVCDPCAVTSDGGSTSYYELPSHATELNDLIEHKGISFALGNIFKACCRFREKDAAPHVRPEQDHILRGEAQGFGEQQDHQKKPASR